MKSSSRPDRSAAVPLGYQKLEERETPDVSVSMAGHILGIASNDADTALRLVLDRKTRDIVVRDGAQEVGRFANDEVDSILIQLGAGNDRLVISRNILQPVHAELGAGNDFAQAGGGAAYVRAGEGSDTLIGGVASDTLVGGSGRSLLFSRGDADLLMAGDGENTLVGGLGADTLVGGNGQALLVSKSAANQILGANALNTVVGPSAAGLDIDGNSLIEEPSASVAGATPDPLTKGEVNALLQRAGAASASQDAIIVIVDRNGTILGVRVEDGVSPVLTGSIDQLTFAIDGAVAKARTGAFFGNNQAPLTSRTVQFISQSTITEREVDSNPNIPDVNSTARGPGFVAPVGINSHFPPNVPFTPQVDLFLIEHTNRDSLLHPGPDGVKGNGNDIPLQGRFNINPATVPPGKTLRAPESYGFQSGLFINAQARGIATLPGGIPIFKNGEVVGGIGVFFPGQTGFATEENSALSTTYDKTRPDRSLEAEWIAFAALGGSSGANASVGVLGGVAPLQGFDLPFGRIDLVGITLDVFGPGGLRGVPNLLAAGKTYGQGPANPGANRQVTPAGDFLIEGKAPPEGWLVTPQNGTYLSAADVQRIIEQGIAEAERVRAAIRLPIGQRTKMVFSVADTDGTVLGLYRMPDATIFSLDVAVAKARNTAYYDDPSALQPVDQLPGVPAGTSFTARSFRYVALPFFPEAIDNTGPAPFSILNDGGVNRKNGQTVGAPAPASSFQSVQGFDAFTPGRNFRDPNNIANQNGVVFFPGSSAVYKDVNGDGQLELVGGFGVSGDGVDQDDVVTFAGIEGYATPRPLRVDQSSFQDIRIPFQKFNRNPLG